MNWSGTPGMVSFSGVEEKSLSFRTFPSSETETSLEARLRPVRRSGGVAADRESRSDEGMVFPDVDVGSIESTRKEGGA